MTSHTKHCRQQGIQEISHPQENAHPHINPSSQTRLTLNNVSRPREHETAHHFTPIMTNPTRSTAATATATGDLHEAQGLQLLWTGKQKPNPDDQLWFIYPDHGWAAGHSFEITAILRTDKNADIKNCTLNGVLGRCEHKAAVAAGGDRVDRRWSAKGIVCTDAMLEAVGLDTSPPGKVDLLFVFRAVVRSGIWAFYIAGDTTDKVESNRQFTVQLCAGWDQDDCRKMYHGASLCLSSSSSSSSTSYFRHFVLSHGPLARFSNYSLTGTKYSKLNDVFFDEDDAAYDQVEPFLRAVHVPGQGPRRGDRSRSIQLWPRGDGTN